jgi:imidazolonepropionase
LSFDLLIVNAAEVATVASSGDAAAPRNGRAMGNAGVIENGYVAVEEGKITAAGKMADLPAGALEKSARVINAAGRAVLPGFVDPHTHVVYGGDRTHEFKLRIRGASYVEIAQAGGGILSTMRATRDASREELVTAARGRLDRMLLCGTTTTEAKSGYGLTLEAEIRTLEAIAALDREHPIDLIPTFMGAHEIPPEYRSDPEAYVCIVIEEMLPAIAGSGLARFNDVFCEEGVFTVEQSIRILEAGTRLGLIPKIHADELAAGFGGAEAGAASGAISADHLLQISDDGLRALQRSGTIPVCLPGTALVLMMKEYAPARRMIDEFDLPVAIATDCNPGSSPVESMAVVMGLACLQMKMSPAEALVAATHNAACAIGLGGLVGQIAPGFQADIQILSESSFEAIPYRFGAPLVQIVIKRGQVVVEGGVRT